MKFETIMNNRNVATVTGNFDSSTSIGYGFKTDIISVL